MRELDIQLSACQADPDIKWNLDLEYHNICNK